MESVPQGARQFASHVGQGTDPSNTASDIVTNARASNETKRLISPRRDVKLVSGDLCRGRSLHLEQAITFL